MNLFKGTVETLRWFARLARTFFARRPATTCVVLVASVLGRVTGILAFVLPLKIVLLVASDGISRWFQPFVGPGGKDTLIVVLTAVAVVSFFASIAFDALTERLAASTSRTILHNSNELAVVGNQSGQAQDVYAQFAEVVSGVLFTVAGFTVIGLVNWPLVAALTGALVVEFLLTAAFVVGANRVHPGPLARFVTTDLGDYLQILSSVNFLLAFGVILYPFIWGGGGSVMAALVSIIVLRRMLGVMVGTVRGTVKMVRRRPVIDALVFRHHQYQMMEKRAARTLRDIFHKEARQNRTAEALQSAGVQCRELDVHWQDSRLGGVSLLAVRAELEDGSVRTYQQQIYMPKNDYRLENEFVLFDHVPRAKLNAPELVLRFSEGPFECQICTAGSGEPCANADWSDVEWTLRERLLTLAPPTELVRAFESSRPLMADRLSAKLVERVGVAVDTEDESRLFESLCEILPILHELLRELPLQVHNPELQRFNVFRGLDGMPVVMTWGKWTLEPVGVGLSDESDEAGLEELAEAIRRHRTDVPVGFGVHHLQLSGLAWEFEARVTRNFLKGALESTERLLANPLLAGALEEKRAAILKEVGEA